MNRIDDLSHPAIELPLPLSGVAHEFEIPQETTLFFWTALAVGTPDRIPLTQSSLGNRLLDAGIKAQDKMSWSVSIDGEAVPLLADSYYRESGYTGLAWWTACKPVETPASVRVQFETKGEQPTDPRNQFVLWTNQGEPIPWESTIESTIELVPSDSPPSEFPTRKEPLWKRHTVYTPQSKKGLY